MVTACQPSMLKIVGEVFGSRQSSRTIKRLLSVSPAYSNYDENYHDVVIAGGGIMGCSSAFFLAERMPRGTICIIERDPSYARASTVLSISSIRQQFSTKGNILLSLRSFQFLSRISSWLGIEGEEPPDIQMVEDGYLFLATEKGEAVLRENFALQKSLGAEVELMEPSVLSQKYPWLNLDGIALASLGVKNEGWFDSWMLLHAFKKKVLSMGVRFIEGEVTGVNVEDKRVNSVKVAVNSGGGVKEATVGCHNLINACGPWASNLALMAGIGDKNQLDPVLRVPLPVEPRRRCVFAVKSPSGPPGGTPLVIDSSGGYFRREGDKGLYIMGICPPKHEDLANLELDVDYSLFDDLLWPTMAYRVPAFESLKIHNAWAGYYEYNTFDQNGIIGPHPVISNLIFANGFSGHGIQQSPAVGEAISEIILDGRSHSIDLQDFTFERILEGKPIVEKNII